MRLCTRSVPSSMTATIAPISSEEVPWRIQGAVYGIGLFSTSIFHIAAAVSYTHLTLPTILRV